MRKTLAPPAFFFFWLLFYFSFSLEIDSVKDYSRICFCSLTISVEILIRGVGVDFVSFDLSDLNP
jgi:hypothetical protein